MLHYVRHMTLTLHPIRGSRTKTSRFSKRDALPSILSFFGATSLMNSIVLGTNATLFSSYDTDTAFYSRLSDQKV